MKSSTHYSAALNDACPDLHALNLLDLTQAGSTNSCLLCAVGNRIDFRVDHGCGDSAIIHILTDFGFDSPYVGEMKSVLHRALTHQQVVDLFHSAPMFNPRASAYLLAALSRRFEYGDICLAVVDPGVGDPNRRAVVIEADGVTYVGPDNGLFSIIVGRADRTHCMEVIWRPNELSTSFHGRDLFAPIVVKMALRERLESVNIDSDSLVGADWATSLSEIIYLDHYGNAVTGIGTELVNPDCTIKLGELNISYQERFSSVPVNQPFWYINSMELVEVAVNQGNAAQQLGLSIGIPVTIVR